MKSHMHSNRWYVVAGFASRVALNLVLLAVSLACLIPFLVVVSASLSTEEALGQYGYTLWPQQFSTLAYQYIFLDAERIGRAYGVSLLVTLVGSGLGML